MEEYIDTIGQANSSPASLSASASLASLLASPRGRSLVRSPVLSTPSGKHSTTRRLRSSPQSSLRHSLLSGISSSSFGNSPERTPGPGEESPDTLEARQESREILSMLSEAEERSWRRVEAIRGVISGLRDKDFSYQESLHAKHASEDVSRTSAPGAPAGVDVSLDDVITPQRGDNCRSEIKGTYFGGCHIDPTRTSVPPLPCSGRTSSAKAWDDYSFQCADVEDLPEPHEFASAKHPLDTNAAIRGEADGLFDNVSWQPFPSLQQGMMEYVRGVEEGLESRLAQQRAALFRATNAHNVEATEAHAAQLLLVEGLAARQEAQLRAELSSMRIAQQRECERLRTETRRLQVSLKGMQAQLKVEEASKEHLLEEMEATKHQLAVARTEVQDWNRNGRTIRGALGNLEESAVKAEETLKWVAIRCSEALGERSDESGFGSVVDGISHIVGKTLAVLERRAGSASATSDDVGGAKLSSARGLSNAYPTVLLGELSAQRLAITQQEVLHARVEAEEVKASHCELQKRFSEALQELKQAMTLGSNKSVQRSDSHVRICALVNEQEQLNARIVIVESEASERHNSHEEELAHLRIRFAQVLHAKDADEQYIRSEKETWNTTLARTKLYAGEIAELREEIYHSECDALRDREDIAEAQVAADVAEASKRRLESQLVSVEHRKSTFQSALQMQKGEDCIAIARARWRAEFSRREDACFEGLLASQRCSAEWRSAAERAELEAARMGCRFAEERAAIQNLEIRLGSVEQEHERQRVQVDKAKRAMVEKAMDEQAYTLRAEYGRMLDAWRGRLETTADSLTHCEEERDRQHMELESALLHVIDLQKETEAFGEIQACLESMVWSEEQALAHSRFELEANSAKEYAAFREAETRTSKSNSADVGRILQLELSAAQQGASEELEATIGELRRSHNATLEATRHELQAELQALRESEAHHFYRLERTIASLRAQTSELESCAESAWLHASVEAQQANFHAQQEREEKARLEETAKHEEALYCSELFERVRAELLDEVRQDVLHDVRYNSSSALRRELCTDLSHEVRDQLNSESGSSQLFSPSLSQEGSSAANPTAADSIIVLTPRQDKLKPIPSQPVDVDIGPLCSALASANRAGAGTGCLSAPSTAQLFSPSLGRGPLSQRRGETPRRDARGSFAEVADQFLRSSRLSSNSDVGMFASTAGTIITRASSLSMSAPPASPDAPLVGPPIVTSTSLRDDAAAVLARVAQARRSSAVAREEFLQGTFLSPRFSSSQRV